nr:deoxyribonuclease IV [Mumia flava]
MPVSPTRVRNPLGSHVAVGKGLIAGALATATGLGAGALQIFAGNPRGWAASAGDPATDAAFAQRCADDGLLAFVHAPYLVNLGSPNPQTYRRSVDAVTHNLARAASLGAQGLVVHTGSCVDDGGYETALRQVREGLLPLLDALDGSGLRLLLEPTAGQGRSLCARVDDLAPYLAALEDHPAVGICLDTCHAFAAGEPLGSADGVDDTLRRLVAVTGPDRLALVHANDSKDVRGSLKDRHERIGQGHLGTDAFAALLRHPLTDGVPFVLETPGGVAAWREDLALLASLRDA